jgi:hypothetical protein
VKSKISAFRSGGPSWTVTSAVLSGGGAGLLARELHASPLWLVVLVVVVLYIVFQVIMFKGAWRGR